MYLTANINRSRQLETEKQEHQQRTSDSENSNTQYHSNIYNNHIHMQDLELNEASYLGNENPYYSNGIGKVHNKSTRRPQSASAINSKRLGSILEFKGANPNFDHNNPEQPSSAYDMRHRTLPVESMGILNDPTDMKNAMNTTHVSGHHHHNVRPPLPLSHAQGYIDSEDEMEQREKPQSPYNAQGSIKLGEHSTSSAAEEEGEELILKGQYRFDEAEADIYNKFVLMLTNFDVHDVVSAYAAGCLPLADRSFIRYCLYI